MILQPKIYIKQEHGARASSISYNFVNIKSVTVKHHRQLVCPYK